MAGQDNEISWHNVSLSITKPWGARRNLQLLRGVCGSGRSGELIALVGTL
jgi:hypothetical protein